MDIATLIGIIMGLGMIGGGIFAAAAAAGAGTAVFISPSSFIIVFGGMVASVAVAFPLADVLQLGAAIGATFKGAGDSLGSYVDEAVEVSEVARKGATELEGRLGTVKNFFFKDGLQMVVDGYSEEEIADILNTRIDYREVREKAQADLFKTMGNMAPAWGMVGTLIGLVTMLGNLDDPSTIGPSMAVALLTTFYGALLANLVFLPLAAKLETNSILEENVSNMYLLGVSSIGRQENPRRLEMLLNSSLPPSDKVRFFDNN